jgi:hypothetical protein
MKEMKKRTRIVPKIPCLTEAKQERSRYSFQPAKIGTQITLHCRPSCPCTRMEKKGKEEDSSEEGRVFIGLWGNL